MSSSCRWSDNWKRLSRASVNLRSGLPGWSVPPIHDSPLAAVVRAKARSCHGRQAAAVECGDTAFSAPFRLLLLRAIAIGRRRDMLKDTTLTQYLADLDRRLNRIMAAVPLGKRDESSASASPQIGRICWFL